MANLTQLAEQLVNLTVKEVKELTDILKDQYGIEPAAAGAVVVAAAAGGGSDAPAAEEKPAVAKKNGKALIEASDCRTCHKDDAKLIGPAYADVAKKYENSSSNVKMLAEKIINGGQGNWGEIPMSAHPNVSVEDASAMVEYILSLKK